MNHKRAVKKFIGFGFSRNEANSLLYWYKKLNWSNKTIVDRERNLLSKKA